MLLVFALGLGRSGCYPIAALDAQSLWQRSGEVATGFSAVGKFI